MNNAQYGAVFLNEVKDLKHIPARLGSFRRVALIQVPLAKSIFKKYEIQNAKSKVVDA